MFDKSRFERLRIRLTGAHYQPDGWDEAFVVGISWDKGEKRSCIHLLYPNGKEDFMPLVELGRSHLLGSTTILNTIELEEKVDA